jgi:hypothetical protein
MINNPIKFVFTFYHCNFLYCLNLLILMKNYLMKINMINYSLKLLFYYISKDHTHINRDIVFLFSHCIVYYYREYHHEDKHIVK